jgi:PTS system mannose-specific IIB component/fructoselysine and glucoselysine-specific PTS system IIB component
VSVALYRVDDRLIHGQVVVGWGQPLGLGFIVLVDDAVRASPWEQDLYRMGVPANVEVIFASVAEAARGLDAWQRDPRAGIVLAGDIGSIARLAEAAPVVRRVNIGGLHHRPGRTEHLRYVYLTDDEVAALTALAARGVDVFAQDVPTARAVPFKEFA